MASGDRWEDHVGVAVACPPEWEFGTRILVGSDRREWVCLDRGGAIRYIDGTPFVDFLTNDPQYKFGQIIEVELIEP